MDAILTYHVEGEADTPSREVYAEIVRQVQLADDLGYHAAWFAEHHFHVHRGHMPNPLLFALYLAGRTRQIRLGSAVLCVGLHHPLRLAEDIITCDVLTGGRLSIGLGSGSTAPEYVAFGVAPEEQTAGARHARFAEQLDLLEQAWSERPLSLRGRYTQVEAPPVLPRPLRPLADLLWIAANSQSQAAVAGRRGYSLMLSRERTVDQMEALVRAFQEGRTAAGLDAAGGRIAASRALFVGETDEAAEQQAWPAVAKLVERQRETRAEFAGLPPPASFVEAAERTQFLAGGPETVARAIAALRRRVPFSAFHIQPRWDGLPPAAVEASIRRFRRDALPRVG